MSEENPNCIQFHLALTRRIDIGSNNGRLSFSGVELFQKVRRRQRDAVLFDGKVAQDMRLLLPHVHRLLVLESSLEEQNVNHTEVPDKAILFKFLADFRPDQ